MIAEVARRVAAAEAAAYARCAPRGKLGGAVRAFVDARVGPDRCLLCLSRTCGACARLDTRALAREHPEVHFSKVYTEEAPLAHRALDALECTWVPALVVWDAAAGAPRAVSVRDARRWLT